MNNDAHIQADYLPLLWESTIAFLYSEDYAEHLIEFLKDKKISTVLDCACGIGFPSIQVSKAGFDVICSDGYADMLERFQKNCQDAGVTIPVKHLTWSQLYTLYRTFDIVLCRGNSIIYVDSWTHVLDPSIETVLNHIRFSLQKMYCLLNEGGFLYVDISSSREYAAGPRIHEDFGERVFDGEKVHLTWDITHDWDKRVRAVKSLRTIDGIAYTHEYSGFLLKHEELVEILTDVGFEKVEKIAFPGERLYDVYIAYK